MIETIVHEFEKLMEIDDAFVFSCLGETNNDDGTTILDNSMMFRDIIQLKFNANVDDVFEVREVMDHRNRNYAALCSAKNCSDQVQTIWRNMIRDGTYPNGHDYVSYQKLYMITIRFLMAYATKGFRLMQIVTSRDSLEDLVLTSALIKFTSMSCCLQEIMGMSLLHRMLNGEDIYSQLQIIPPFQFFNNMQLENMETEEVHPIVKKALQKYVAFMSGIPSIIQKTKFKFSDFHFTGQCQKICLYQTEHLSFEKYDCQQLNDTFVLISNNLYLLRDYTVTYFLYNGEENTINSRSFNSTICMTLYIEALLKSAWMLFLKDPVSNGKMYYMACYYKILFYLFLFDARKSILIRMYDTEMEEDGVTPIPHIHQDHFDRFTSELTQRTIKEPRENPMMVRCL